MSPGPLLSVSCPALYGYSLPFSVLGSVSPVLLNAHAPWTRRGMLIFPVITGRLTGASRCCLGAFLSLPGHCLPYALLRQSLPRRGWEPPAPVPICVKLTASQLKQTWLVGTQFLLFLMMLFSPKTGGSNHHFLPNVFTSAVLQSPNGSFPGAHQTAIWITQNDFSFLKPHLDSETPTIQPRRVRAATAFSLGYYGPRNLSHRVPSRDYCAWINPPAAASLRYSQPCEKRLQWQMFRLIRLPAQTLYKLFLSWPYCLFLYLTIISNFLSIDIWGVTVSPDMQWSNHCSFWQIRKYPTIVQQTCPR